MEKLSWKIVKFNQSINQSIIYLLSEHFTVPVEWSPCLHIKTAETVNT